MNDFAQQPPPPPFPFRPGKCVKVGIADGAHTTVQGLKYVSPTKQLPSQHFRTSALFSGGEPGSG